MKIAIKNHPGLARDLNSKAVVNTDQQAYEAAKKIKETAEEKDQRLEAVEKELIEIKRLVKTLLEK